MTYNVFGGMLNLIPLLPVSAVM